MVGPFFALAARSPRRQYTLRLTTVLHLLTVTCAMVFHLQAGNAARSLPLLGHILFTLAIIEGAVLIGWRLTQMPKSQSLEFLLVSPVQPAWVFLAEALTGLAQLLLVTLTSAPLLLWLVTQGRLLWEDVPLLLLHCFTWGAFTGLGLALWAYEPQSVRKWGERVVLVLVAIYLIVGVLFGEKFFLWLRTQPTGFQILNSFHYNPFWVTQDWLLWDHRANQFFRPGAVLQRAVWVQLGASFLILVFLLRASSRLKGHFHERHYSPITDPTNKNRGQIGNRPLSWWSTRRVMEYAGRANIYAAGGFSSVYACYILFEQHWPAYLGTNVFVIIERGMGGLPGIATGLVLLAAVPAAFQYGLWDSSVQERARRMELLLLTALDAWDYFLAALAAAWRRGRGYMLAVFFLWTAGLLSGRLDGERMVCTLVATLILWLFSFAMGFWAFARGVQANALGSLLTLGLPLVAGGIALGLKMPAGMVVVPPGFVFAAMTQGFSWLWCMAVVVYGLVGIMLLRWTLRHAEVYLRQWYNLNHGKKAEGAA